MTIYNYPSANIIGPTGVTGPGGATGATGDGTSGFSGFSGVSGRSGASGVSGASGTGGVGASGFSGFSGYSGTAGASGRSGFSGFSGRGESGFSGFSGTGGTSGASGRSGFIGFSGFSGFSGEGGLGESGFSGISGASGASGRSGASGASGASGRSGFSGFSGEGLSGTSGASGRSGFSGFSGRSGFSGDSGLSGAVGASGTSGRSGYSGRGESGFSGFSGQNGSEKGDSGFSGATGTSGFSGFSGQNGSEKGDSGFSGFSGASGASGLSGDSGATGTSGFSGFSGATGISGTSGASGFSGFSGMSGFSSFSGMSGVSGASGRSGFSGQPGASGFSGNNIFIDGSAAAPSIFFQNDTDTGFYRTTPTNGIGITVDGSQKANINGTAMTMFVPLSITASGTTLSLTNSTTTMQYTSSGIALDFNATNRIDLNSGGIEISRTSGPYIDFKNTIGEDYDIRISTTTNGALTIASPTKTLMQALTTGQVAFGSGAGASHAMLLRSDITGGTIANGLLMFNTVKSDVTSQAYGFRTLVSTDAQPFTLTQLIHYHANTDTVGAGSAISNQYGFFTASGMGDKATNTYGFFSDIDVSATGKNNWNLYATGTAPNYLKGNTYVNVFNDAPGFGSSNNVQGMVLRSTGQMFISSSAVGTLTVNQVSSSDVANIVEFRGGGELVGSVGRYGNFTIHGQSVRIGNGEANEKSLIMWNDQRYLYFYHSTPSSDVGLYDIGSNNPGAPGFGFARWRSEVNGNFIAWGTVTGLSDERVKKDVFTISNALDKVKQLRGVSYTRSDTEQKGIGVIAQELQQVVPDAVVEGSDGMLSVAYGNLVGLLIEAIKELAAQIENR